MMPPPSMMPSHAGPSYPGPGGMGKLHTSAGMVHMGGPGQGSNMQTNPNMYGGQMYGNQPSAGELVSMNTCICSSLNLAKEQVLCLKTNFLYELCARFRNLMLI